MHFSDDLTAYIEEIDMVWDLAMKISNNGYKKIFFYGHSTGVSIEGLCVEDWT